MTQVLDYSAGFPGAQAIRAAGYAGAVRYIGFPDRRKCATAGELADFTANQIGMALIYENTLTEWRNGYGAGQTAGWRARDHANSIGFPGDRPIYVAIDQDVVTNGEFGRMTDYLRGAADALGGPGRTGVYGEADAIDHAREQGLASWFWQTAAWSRGRRTACHLYQHVGTVYVGGIACDVNDAQSDDWGQHTMEDDVAWTDALDVSAPGDRSYTETHQAKELLGDTYYWSADMFRAMMGVVVPMLTQLAANAAGDINASELAARIDTAVREASAGAVATSILPAVQRAQAALAANDTEGAHAIVNDLAARLAPPQK